MPALAIAPTIDFFILPNFGEAPVAVFSMQPQVPSLPVIQVGTSAVTSVDLVAAMASMEQHPSWLGRVTANARRLAELRPGWDGAGSVPIAQDVLSTAVEIIRRSLEGLNNATAPHLVPGGDGSVQIEWHEERGELELDIDTNGGLSIWGRAYGAGAEFEGEDEEALNLLYRWAPWLAAETGDGLNAPISSSPASFATAA